MRDDTRGDEASFAGFQFSTSIDEILQHRFKRLSAARWARNLRFLTYAGNENDTDVQTPEVLDSSKEQRLGQCTRCELRVPPPAGHICATHAKPRQSDIKAYERRTRDYSNPCIHVENARCEECMQIPLFPNHCGATKFRIRRLKPKDTRPSRLGICTHYVAVSYCWSSAQRSGESNAGSEKYQVLEEDMRTVRPIRAPMDVIDRAVSFAAQNGIRMIWIDQVIDQPPLNMLNFIAPNTVPRNASSRITRLRKNGVSKQWILCIPMRTYQLACFVQHLSIAIWRLCYYSSSGKLARICHVAVHAHSTIVEISEWRLLLKL